MICLNIENYLEKITKEIDLKEEKILENLFVTNIDYKEKKIYLFFEIK